MTKVRWAGSCNSSPASATSFSSADSRADLWFYATGVLQTDQLRLIWVQPDGGTPYSMTWNSISGNACFGAWLWISDDLSVTAHPGTWTARVLLNGTTLFELPFNITTSGAPSPPVPTTGPPRLSGLTRSQFTPGDLNVTVSGQNFQAGALMIVDYYIGSDFQWNVATIPTTVDSATQLHVTLSLPDPGEFHLRIENPDQQQSEFVTLFVGLGGYHLPYSQGESWKTTQGNNESGGYYDHTDRLAYAYDFSAGPGKCVVAMKSGYIYDIYDRGLGQTTSLSPGNYITITHGRNEYSHYFHLKTGTFVVSPGQFVEQGQALAIVGNSGYAFSNTPGDGGGTHVHVQVTRSPTLPAQTVPFVFDEVPKRNPAGPPPGQAVRPTFYVSQNSSRFAACNASSNSGPPSEADIAWSAIRTRARSDSRFGTEITGSQNLDSNWGRGTSMRDLRMIDFQFTRGRTVRIFHAFYSNASSNLGATIFLDPDTNAWTTWINVQP
jgi:hypothetical protein